MERLSRSEDKFKIAGRMAQLSDVDRTMLGRNWLEASDVLLSDEHIMRIGPILCLCRGNVLRSQTAAEYLRSLGVPAMSAAVGNVSEQTFQGRLPSSIPTIWWLKGFGKHEYNRWIKPVNPWMIDIAKRILIFCEPINMNECVRIDDPRVSVVAVDDVGNMGDVRTYHKVINAVTSSVDTFLRDNFPEVLVKNYGKLYLPDLSQ